MTSTKPYFFRAIYEWLTDNQFTPYVMVDALKPGVEVPQEFVEDGQVVLNMSMDAIRNLEMSNHDVQFDARFSGVTRHIHLPMDAILSLYAAENGQGMVFSEEDEDGDGSPPDDTPPPPKKPNLKIVK